MKFLLEHMWFKNYFSWKTLVSLAVVVLGFSITGCSITPTKLALPTKTNTTLFYNLTWSAGLKIKVIENIKLSWQMGIDAFGAGLRCSSDDDKICMQLEGLWVFSLPKNLLGSPKPGIIWTYEGVEFKIDSIIRLPLNDNKYDEALLISSYTKGKQSTLFLYSKFRGLLYIMSIEDKCELEKKECLNSLVDSPVHSIWSSAGWKF